MSSNASTYLMSNQEDILLKGMTLAHNHCNLPSKLIASLGYQRHPVPIEITTLEPWLACFCKESEALSTSTERASLFEQIMQLRFGVQPAKRKKSDLPGNIQSHYRTLLLGWIFDPNSASGALWRHWVESRFGLLTRYHHTPIAEPDSVDYLHYLTLTTSVFTDHQGLFEQLDFLYFYCQLELKLRMSHQTHLVLYRGFSNLDIQQLEGESVAHLNNLSSLSSDPEMAFQFGTHIVRVSVPLYKVVCFDSLLPRILHGEQEYMVLGGLYQVERLTDVR